MSSVIPPMGRLLSSQYGCSFLAFPRLAVITVLCSTGVVAGGGDSKASNKANGIAVNSTALLTTMTAQLSLGKQSEHRRSPSTPTTKSPLWHGPSQKPGQWSLSTGHRGRSSQPGPKPTPMPSIHGHKGKQKPSADQSGKPATGKFKGSYTERESARDKVVQSPEQRHTVSRSKSARSRGKIPRDSLTRNGKWRATTSDYLQLNDWPPATATTPKRHSLPLKTPAQASVNFQVSTGDDNRLPLCSGARFSHTELVTSAHCLGKIKPYWKTGATVHAVASHGEDYGPVVPVAPNPEEGSNPNNGLHVVTLEAPRDNETARWPEIHTDQPETNAAIAIYRGATAGSGGLIKRAISESVVLKGCQGESCVIHPETGGQIDEGEAVFQGRRLLCVHSPGQHCLRARSLEKRQWGAMCWAPNRSCDCGTRCDEVCFYSDGRLTVYDGCASCNSNSRTVTRKKNDDYTSSSKDNCTSSSKVETIDGNCFQRNDDYTACTHHASECSPCRNQTNGAKEEIGGCFFDPTMTRWCVWMESPKNPQQSGPAAGGYLSVNDHQLNCSKLTHITLEQGCTHNGRRCYVDDISATHETVRCGTCKAIYNDGQVTYTYSFLNSESAKNQATSPQTNSDCPEIGPSTSWQQTAEGIAGGVTISGLAALCVTPCLVCAIYQSCRRPKSDGHQPAGKGSDSQPPSVHVTFSQH